MNQIEKTSHFTKEMPSDRGRAAIKASRHGHLESSLALMVLAGRQPSGVLCELMHADGTTMRGEALHAYCARHELAWVTVEDLTLAAE